MSAIQLQILQYLISSLPTLYNYYNYYNSYSKYIAPSSLLFNKSIGNSSNDFNFYGDYERELENIQMDKLLKWMSMVFEDDISNLLKLDENKENNENHDNKEEKLKAYKKELYNIYVTIKSDYLQYLERKKYNSRIWILSSYRQKNTKELSKKIILDIQLFYEGLKMFSLFEKMN